MAEFGITKTITKDGKTTFSIGIPDLSAEAAFDYLNTARSKTKGVTVTISGAAGTGKSFVGHKVVEALKAAGFEVVTDSVESIREEFAADPERFTTVASGINVVVREVRL